MQRRTNDGQMATGDTITATTDDVQTFKILLIGDSGVGKSSLLLRFTANTFLPPASMTATIGVDFKTAHVQLPNAAPIRLNIWDTAGQERFRTLTSSYYRHAQGIIFVYDVTSRETLDNLKQVWWEEAEMYASPEAVRMVVGNKLDRTEDRQVLRREGEAMARDLGALFVECSALSSQGVRQAFEELCEKILERPECWPQRPGAGGDETVRVSDGNQPANADSFSSCSC